MKKIILIVGAFIVIAVIVFTLITRTNEGKKAALSSALTSKPCVLYEKLEPYPNSYQGPLIDTHIHIPPIPDGPVGLSREENGRPALGLNVNIADYVCMMENEGTQKVFAFFPVWEPIVEESLQVVKETTEKYPDRFIPFIMPPDHDDRVDGFPTVSASDLDKMLQIYPKMFKGFGEIGLYERGDHGGPKGALALPPDSKRLREIYPLVEKNNLLVYFHLGEGQKESFEKTLAANPDINFIWHGDQLVEYKDGRQNLEHLDEILTRHPNAYYGIDELYGDVWLLRPEVKKEEFLAHFENYESLLDKDLDTWKGFIERHPDQVLWGTDRGWNAPWSLDPTVGMVLARYSRAFIGRLDLAVQEKIAYKNALNLLEKTK